MGERPKLDREQIMAQTGLASEQLDATRDSEELASLTPLGILRAAQVEAAAREPRPDGMSDVEYLQSITPEDEHLPPAA